MNNGTNSKKPSLEQLGALAGFIVEFLAGILNFEQIGYWLKHKTALKQKLREVFSITDEYVEFREEWQKFWKAQLGWGVDFSGVIIPPKPQIGSWRLLILPKGMTNNKMFARMEQMFKCWKYTNDLDAEVPINARTTENHYAVWVRDGVEPDEEFLEKSVCEADLDMKIGMTLLERLTFGIKYFAETGKHLDIKGVTLCSGSRHSCGDVPYVRWDPLGGTVLVGWRNVDSAGVPSGSFRLNPFSFSFFSRTLQDAASFLYIEIKFYSIFGGLATFVFLLYCFVWNQPQKQKTKMN